MRFLKKIFIFFVLLKADIQLKYAIKEAEEKYKKGNVRYYVIPNFNHKLITCSRAEIRRYRTEGYFDHSAKMDNFKDECFYYTPYANGQDPISVGRKENKRKLWLNYVLQSRNLI